MFIALEGGEGAGKSTLAAALAARVRSLGRDVVAVREPGGTRAGEQVRALLHERLTPWAEAFAFLAARAQLVAEVVAPALASGSVVICDRFAGSTLAYQGFGRGLPLEELERTNSLATGGLEPELVLYLDIAPEPGLARKRGEEEAIRTGMEDLAFHGRVRAGYLELAATRPGQWQTLDATEPADVLAERAWTLVEPRLR